MLTDQPTDILLTQFVDALSDPAVYFAAVRDEQHQLVDLQVAQANEGGCQLVAQGVFDAGVGERMLGDDPQRRRLLQPLFRQYAALLLTGETQTFDFLNPVVHRIVHVTRSRLGDGVLVVVRDSAESASQSAKLELADQLSGILEASLNGIITYEAIRSREGSVADFRFVRLNQAALQMLSLTTEVIGKPMLSELPGIREKGLFERFVRVVETGRAERFETAFPAGDQSVWYAMSAVKLGDGFVVTFNDITESKRAALENERQHTLLEGILNATQDAIWVFQPIRDADGVIVDFRYTHANRATTAMFGFSTDEFLQSSYLTLYPMAHEADTFAPFRRVMETGEPFHREFYYGDFDGPDVWYDINAVRLGEGAVVTVRNISDHKRIEQQLEQQAEELRTTFDSSLSGIFTMIAIRDEQGTITDFRFRNANRAVKQNLNKEPEELIGHTLLELFPGNIETGFFDVYARVCNTGHSERYLQYYTDSNHFTGWFDVSVVKQEPDGVINTFLNATQQVEASLRSEQQADLLNSILNSSNSGIIAFESVRDQTGRIADFQFITANRACEQLVGVSLETMRGSTLLTLFPGNVDSGLFALYVRTTETGEPGRTETYYNYDGLDFWLDISAEKLGDGFVVTFNDVSEVKRAARAVEEAAANLQAIIDNSQTAIFLLAPAYDDAGQIVDFTYRALNQTLASYVRQTPAVMLGTPVSRWFPTYKNRGNNFRRYCEVFTTGQPQRFEIHYDGDGVEAWLDVAVARVGDEILVTFLDYSPLKKLQQQLENSVVDLQRSNANLEQFAYVASHDLQEPLRKIQAFGDIIQTNYAPVIGDEGADMIRRMQAAAARMQVLIKDVLAYSRVATKRETAGPVDLGRLVGDVVDDLETVIEAKCATVEISPLPTVAGDAPQLRQLFQNLISNALKFVKPATTGTEQPTVRITSQTLRGRDAGMNIPPGDASRLFHRIEIVDNGIGFEPHQSERIFQVFQRLHGRTEYPGTGIGLAIVKKVIENHQGYIQAVGQPGVGATFRILLPAEGR